ncbi:hypothetical protein LJC19_07920 [Oxalobacter sp. OttesenSCG-928-P03]|nr:hypothetical protein [Oxalobacter sp. OttesenSCG-928-P03]
MYKRNSRTIGVLAGIALVIVLWGAGWTWSEKGIASAEFAAWIQAIGVIAAIFTGIVIVTADRSRYAEKESEAGLIFYRLLGIRLVSLVDDLKPISQWFYQCHQEDGDPEIIGDHLDRLKKNYWEWTAFETMQQIIHIVPISTRYGHSIVNGIDNLNLAIRAIESHPWRELQMEVHRRDLARRVALFLDSALDEFGIVFRMPKKYGVQEKDFTGASG